MGKYVPPDLEGTISGNKLHGKHPLGARGNKASQGILTVRFEMPYPIWCTTCPKPTIIGQGVRFNAQKRRVGNYHSTPIWAFRMTHVACGGAIEIRTDPRNTAYVVTEGARARDHGDERRKQEEETEGLVPILTEGEREERRGNAFAALEGKNDDVARLAKARVRVEEIQDVQDRQWDDPYEMNRRLRSRFRVGRHAREKDAKISRALQEKMSLGIELLPATEEDARRARMIDFGSDEAESSLDVLKKPLFEATSNSNSEHSKTRPKGHRLKSANAADMHKAVFAETIRSNTRAKTDPFLNFEKESEKERRTPLLLKTGGVKRKRNLDVSDASDSMFETEADSTSILEKDVEVGLGATNNDPSSNKGSGLVDYDSD